MPVFLTSVSWHSSPSHAQALLDSDQAVVRDMVAPIAHLFYWAFRSAAASSEADEHTLKLAQQWRGAPLLHS
eukprot:6469803-Amphidinium_carterae.1